MKFFLFISFSVLLPACSSETRTDAGRDAAPLQRDTARPAEAFSANSAHPSAAFRQFVTEAGVLGFVPADTTAVFGSACSADLFGLLRPGNVFASSEMRLISHARVFCLELEKKSDPEKTRVTVAEWGFPADNDVQQVIDAMSKPVSGPGEERFTTDPFAFWQKLNRLYYFRCAEEKYRTDLNRLSEKMAELVTKYN